MEMKRHMKRTNRWTNGVNGWMGGQMERNEVVGRQERANGLTIPPTDQLKMHDVNVCVCGRWLEHGLVEKKNLFE
jgi:hypothetical protein